MINKLKLALSEHQEEYLNLLMDLVSIDTQHIGQGIDGGNEAPGQEYLAKLAENIGADKIEYDQMEECYIQEAIDNHNEGNSGHNYVNRENLYITFGEKEEKKTIMFNGHMDTMPPGPLELWDSPPHQPTIKDDKLYGLGTADMKSGLIASILAVKLIKDAGLELNSNVIVTSVTDEEGGGNGSIQAAIKGITADATVVCEGTDYELILAHMGFIFFRVTVEGKANHAGEKWKGVNAIDKVNKIIAWLKDEEYKWLFSYKHPLLPPPNINFGIIRGGSSGATVPGQCMVEFCIHYHPNTMNFDMVKDIIYSQIQNVSEADEWLKNHPPKIEIFQAGGAYEMDEQSDIVNTFKNSYYSVFKKEVPIVGSPAGCDSRIWKNIGRIDTIQYGPGRLTECHSANEYVRINEFFDSILIYAMLIQNFK